MPDSELFSQASPHRILISSLATLEKVAEILCQFLTAGDVIGLMGDLGAGKTTLAQLIARGLGVTEKVTSPTFVLMHEYLSGQIPIIHTDLYRLGPGGSLRLEDELLAIIANQEGLLIVEWADYGPFLHPCLTLSLKILINPDNSRILEFETEKTFLLQALAPFIMQADEEAET